MTTDTAPVTRSAGEREPVAGLGWSRALLAALALALATAALAAADVGSGIVGLAFLTLGPGIVICHRLRTGDGVSGFVPAFAAGTCVLMLLASVALWLDAWNPRAWTIALALVVAAAAAAALWRDRGAVEARRLLAIGRLPRDLVDMRLGRSATVLVALTVLAAIGWAASLHTIDPADAEVGGLLAGASPLLAASLVLVLVCFLMAVRARSWPAALVAFGTTLLILRVTTPLVAEEPMYDWSFKHVGVAEFILEQGRVVTSVDIYHSWPGFFAASAWIADVTGIGAVTQAMWFTPVIVLLGCVAIAALARRVLSASPWVGVVAAYLFLILSWVGQDYFAPQALAVLLTLVILNLVLARGMRAGTLAVLLFAGMVVSHQLTPFILLAIVLVLAIGRRVDPWVAIAFAVLAVGFMLTRLDVLSDYGIFSGVNAAQNAQTSGGEFSSTAKDVDSWSARGLMAVLWLAAAGVLVWRWRRRREWFAGAVLTFVPFALLLGQSYGGEALLRVALFSLVGCAIVLAPAVDRLLASSGVLRPTAATAGVLMLGTLAAQAYFGPWYTNQVSSSEVRVARALLADIPPPAYVAPAIPGWPDRPGAAYVEWVQRAGGDYDSSAFDEWLTGSDFTDPRDLSNFERLHLQSRGGWPTFLILSRRMEAVNAYRGFYAPDALANMRTVLPQREGWSVVLEDGDITVLRYVPPVAQDTPAATWSPS